MKKLIFIVLFLTLAIVFSLSVMAQSAPEDVNVPNTATNEQLQSEAVVYCPFAQDGRAGCYILDYDGAETENSNPPGCCQFDQLQSQTVSSQYEGDSTSAPSQIRKGCCGR